MPLLAPTPQLRAGGAVQAALLVRVALRPPRPLRRLPIAADGVALLLRRAAFPLSIGGAGGRRKG
eukprot:scaffold135437_cov90-Phaeocystis_antarctica.AAC.1